MSKTNKINDFQDKLKSIYPEQANEILETHYKEPRKSFRILNVSNSEKVFDLLKSEDFEFEETFVPNCFKIKSTSKNQALTHATAHFTQQIYMQELSSMLPPYLLMNSLEKVEMSNILDLCAAPGSKAGQLKQMLQENTRIFVNEPNKKRFFRMQFLLKELYPGKNFEFLSTDGVMLPYKRPELTNFFDAVMVDAPCSNEGSLRLDSADGLKYWSKSEAKKLSKLQKGLLNAGLKMLKPGGTLIYSTCTYSVEENELVVNWALEKWGNKVELEQISIPIKNLAQGFLSYKNKSFDKSISKTIRIIPDGEWKGFYLAVFRKIKN